MTTYTEVWQLATQLSLAERAHLVAELLDALTQDTAALLTAQAWDQQIAADIKSGKLDTLAEAILADFTTGHCTPL